MTNIKLEAMRDKIRKILVDNYHFTDCEDVVNELLVLYNVRQRSELLLFADYSESDKVSQTTDECVDNYLDQK